MENKYDVYNSSNQKIGEIRGPSAWEQQIEAEYRAERRARSIVESCERIIKSICKPQIIELAKQDAQSDDEISIKRQELRRKVIDARMNKKKAERKVKFSRTGILSGFCLALFTLSFMFTLIIGLPACGSIIGLNINQKYIVLFFVGLVITIISCVLWYNLNEKVEKQINAKEHDKIIDKELFALRSLLPENLSGYVEYYIDPEYDEKQQEQK